MKGGISGVTTVARGAPNDVRSGAQVRLLARLQPVQLPAQLSNLTGPAKSGRYEPVLVPRMCTHDRTRADAMYRRLTRLANVCGLAADQVV
ncbi:hypothetical protein ABIB68_002200 [Bradyrhizobium sp. F1.2.2]